MNFFSGEIKFAKNPKTIPALFLFLAIICRLSALSFTGLDLSADERLLFRADFEHESALFISNLYDLSMRQLTAYPEKLELVDDGRTIYAHSRFGTVRIPASGGIPEQLPGFPSLTAGKTPLKGRLQESAASSDGRWILYVEPTSAAYGNLFLIETARGERRLVSEKIELPAADFPARWSPDSRLFVYSKGGKLYYFPILGDISIVTEERFRQMGSGGINSVLWDQQREFYYLFGNTLYRISNPELFTRSIYGDFLSIGSVAGTLPVDFDSNFDRFWLAPDAKSILLNKNGKSIFYFPLGANQDSNVILPHVIIPGGVVSVNVLWSPSGHLTVTSEMPAGKTVWRFEINGRSINQSMPRENPASCAGVLSPDGTKALFWGESGLELWDYQNWRLIQILSREPVLSCAWMNNNELVTGNANFITGINITDRTSPRRRIICLSSAEEFGFEDAETTRGSRILAKTDTAWFVSDGRSPWTQITNPKVRNASLTSERHRVFLEPQSSGYYKNIPMIRNLSSTGTVPLVSGYSAGSAYKHDAESQVALCFDLYDDDTGLFQVMDALRRLKIKATFFLNGDFIRRNPRAAAAIIEAGHETASLFYAPIDLSDTRYRVDRGFITQGLARNEDEFNKATGKELAMLWHPPFYRNSETISAAAASAGYVTVSRDIDCGDWLSRDEAARLGIRRNSASEIIERIIERKKHGAVIPVRLGLLPGGRDDYLYQRIDVLLDALARSGCEIVPVSVFTGK
ncbi:MAG: polysaccharide deacetylase family protein [Treponema sp.]|jgi:peptidoglycan/xylan/chitin deacetylase (PgdA/CDA1 family)|nr:polysaccharide deacetylase family protein [Treponema sp.]